MKPKRGVEPGAVGLVKTPNLPVISTLLSQEGAQKYGLLENSQTM